MRGGGGGFLLDISWARQHSLRPTWRSSRNFRQHRASVTWCVRLSCHSFRNRARFFGPLTPIFGVIDEERWHGNTTSEGHARAARRVVLGWAFGTVLFVRLCAYGMGAVGNLGYQCGRPPYLRLGRITPAST